MIQVEIPVEHPERPSSPDLITHHWLGRLILSFVHHLKKINKKFNIGEFICFFFFGIEFLSLTIVTKQLQRNLDKNLDTI